ncbi:DUF692 domain-containing protein [Saccharospirillum alexandrii]|uniref:MNIO family bufferin maturase n=1 Tax=Saccharospirillum alexandrii TaxID=2448477 RepID=UPI000FD6FF31|nr:DUF692 domain-containing protein [Saccharospirillum alexandrii]
MSFPEQRPGFHDTVAAGVSLKPQHFEQAMASRLRGIWYEVHPENYLMQGGPRRRGLRQVAADRDISFHGVGASLGGPDLPDADHLKAIRQLVDDIQPVRLSEHAVWSSIDQTYLAELLPLPRTQPVLLNLVAGVDVYQSAMGRTILIENPTNYLTVHSDMDEADFLLEVSDRTGCGLLLDINNLYLSAHNVGIDPKAYIKALPPKKVGEIHIAGFDADPQFGHRLLIDSHASAVADPVWSLLDYALTHLGPKPVLIERDANLPEFSVLEQEVHRAQRMLDRLRELDHA